MKAFLNKFKYNKENLIRNSFLIPIFLVVVMSISHVVSWYNLGNPITWAIYLSIAIEIFALASISAASIKASKTTIWILFGIVTMIQIVGNVFYGFNTINIENESFKSWVDLIGPFFINWDQLDHRRFLAIIQGGTLPILSLTALHFYIQFKDKEGKSNNISTEDIIKAGKEAEIKSVMEKAKKAAYERKANMSKEEYDDMLNDEPSALANSKYSELDLTKADVDTIIESIEDSNEPNEALKEAANDFKNKQREYLSEMMKSDEELGLYEDSNSPINDKSKMVESGSGLPSKPIRNDKGNNATIKAARKEINPKTGKFN